MKLRKPCEHGRYDEHRRYRLSLDWPNPNRGDICPGGEFLADDALVIEKVNGEWDQWAVDILNEFTLTPRQAFDALTVREGAE